MCILNIVLQEIKLLILLHDSEIAVRLRRHERRKKKAAGYRYV